MINMHNAQRGSHLWPAPKNTFFSPDNEGGTPPPAADAATDTGDGAGTGDDAAPSVDGGAGKSFTQEDVNQIVGKRVSRAEEAAVKSLLSKFNFETVEAAEEFLNSARQKADAELSEVERLKKQLGEAPTAETVAELTQRIEAQDAVITSLVEATVKELNVPSHVTELLETMTPTQRLDYINKHRSAFTQKPAAPNLNGGDNGKLPKSEAKKKRQASVKSRIPALNKRR
jgi:hypothetical protein